MDARAHLRALTGGEPQRALFQLFRIVFGLYLAVHFAMLVPYADEL